MGNGETSSAMSKNVYEVFLSFRGPDTRQGFTDCLYHAMVDAGITVFRDDDELRPGDKLVDILTAIDNSKLCVVVFSRTFAVSAWCLREVERMIEKKKEILPVFVDVSPDDVKLKTTLYHDALSKHETKYGKEQAEQWREALMEIPRIKGRELKNSGFVEFSRQLVKQILTKLQLKKKYEIPELVEVPDEVEDALKLLNIESHDERRFLGIHGIGGIGKTTLAKIVFNQICDSFDCSCFLENVRESLSQGHDGLSKMQEKLLKSLNPLSIDVKKNFKNKKVIIVLDDIDEKSQIHRLVGDSASGWFGLGSRIIFTTRKASLHEQMISSNATFEGLEKKEMNSKQALELFSKHAFGRDSPPEDFKDLSNEVISVTSGLPLALEVVGSFLCQRNAEVWRSTIKKLEEAPFQDVQRKLRLSYDALEFEQQEMFLDIACYFIDKDNANALYMWEACGFNTGYGIEVLLSMSLIKIGHKECFTMHDQLRDFGRAIVNENSRDPRAGSRLWLTKEALDQLRKNPGKEQVEAVQLYGDYSTSLDREDFVGLKKLRFLYMRNGWNFTGEFVNLLPKLRWLSLSEMSFNATNLCHKELAILELFRCKLEVDWHGWSQFLSSKRVRVLTIQHCDGLPSMPDLSKLVKLEKLVFSYCDKLTSIHSSVWKLRCLKHLVLECSSYDKSPIESLSSPYDSPRPPLNLPESIGCMVNLTTLSLCYICFTNLPKDIGKLVKLEHLSLCGCRTLKVIPESIGDLVSLVSLDLMSTGITEVPTTIGRLTKLKSLNLSKCWYLHSLPNSVGDLHSLIDLNLAGSSVAQLPNSFGDLASLQKLDLRNLRVLLGSIKDLKKLQVLDIGNNTVRGKWIDEVHELPAGLTVLTIHNVRKIQISNLTNLSHLEIRNTNRLSYDEQHVVIEGFEKLSKLEQLELQCFIVKSLSMELSASQQLTSLKLHCPKLEIGQCQLPCSLELLHLKVKDWGVLPLRLPSLKNLSELSLTHFGADVIEGIEEEAGYARSISMDLSALQRLKSLTLCCFKLEFRQCQLPSSLESLELKVKQWGQLPINLSSLKNLLELKLTNFSMESADEIEGLESLKYLRINDTVLKFNCFPGLISLTYLWLNSCEFPSKCLDMSQLDRLNQLSIESADGLVEISGIGKVEHLSISNCKSFQMMEDISKLNELQRIYVINCVNFLGIDGIDRVLSAQTDIVIRDCKCNDVWIIPSEVEDEEV